MFFKLILFIVFIASATIYAAEPECSENKKTIIRVEANPHNIAKTNTIINSQTFGPDILLIKVVSSYHDILNQLRCSNINLKLEETIPAPSILNIIRTPSYNISGSASCPQKYNLKCTTNTLCILNDKKIDKDPETGLFKIFGSDNTPIIKKFSSQPSVKLYHSSMLNIRSAQTSPSTLSNKDKPALLLKKYNLVLSKLGCKKSSLKTQNYGSWSIEEVIEVSGTFQCCKNYIISTGGNWFWQDNIFVNGKEIKFKKEALQKESEAYLTELKDIRCF